MFPSAQGTDMQAVGVGVLASLGKIEVDADPLWLLSVEWLSCPQVAVSTNGEQGGAICE
jgi:hypothetical protein